jgi:succinate dehydrogenase hydrophobic anchor subunit
MNFMEFILRRFSVAFLELSVVAGMARVALQSDAQTQTNAWDDSFVTQWTENFTTETILSSRCHGRNGHPTPAKLTLPLYLGRAYR